jgi:hypothetical protein
MITHTFRVAEELLTDFVIGNDIICVHGIVLS